MSIIDYMRDYGYETNKRHQVRARFAPLEIMANPSQKRKDVLRNIYDSEELKIDSNRSKAIAKTIEMLCTGENSLFNNLYDEVSALETVA